MDTIQRTTYDKNKLIPKILHLGFGAFHRAHQALFADQLARISNSDWGYAEVNLIGGEELIELLKKQDLQYCVLEKGNGSNTAKIINSVCEALHAKVEGVDAVLEKMAEPQIAIVSLTVTEKGYCTDLATGKLDQNNPLILKDLANPQQPTSAIGYIVEALRRRKVRSLAPFTVMSCDNVMENGHIAKSAVLGLAYQIDPELAQWIEQKVTFPCTMVDRIVPAATDETLQEIADILGYYDPCAIACEEFKQWVIEDNFVADRPQWELVGAELVKDVRPFEQMKLRMLNGSHSFLAYLGYLGGYQHISDTMQDPHYRQAALKLMLNEQAPTLSMPDGIDLPRYADLLIERFTNPSLKHRTWQIAMDGSQKLPPRMLESVLYHLSNQYNFPLLTLGIAAWMRYVSGVDEQQQPIEVKDPLSEKFDAIYQKCGLHVRVVEELLAIDSIFPSSLRDNAYFVSEVKRAYQTLLDLGAKQAVSRYLQLN
ncbi:fructuronate reductase [Pasteurellaceae bacterium USgator11]|nr:fructuronate reductase [Pasteurellaceae bacterium USgator41]TNG97244.1 fructuronate reductase [Pasteurellaceae bacterium UScroc12]TNG99822.1 fructuronate reductase [Pasteurellaceae bacterium UScroc31]TNH01075.1 fructuronate reductase [Pasteurellaceae bacterium USgator11]